MGKPQKTRKPVRFLRRAGIALVALAVVAGAAWWLLKPADPVTQLQQRSRTLPMLALADPQLKPPTNKWFSSLAFKQPSDPVFAYPLAFQTTAHGFAVSQPRVTASADTVDATFMRDIGVAFDGAAIKSYVRSYDDLSVELEVRSGERVLGFVRITQGSPYIFMTLQRNTKVTFSAEQTAHTGDIIALQRGSTRYEMLIGQNAAAAGASVTASADGAPLALYAVPSQADIAALREAAKHPITRTEATYNTDGSAVRTTFTIQTNSGKPTLLGMLPGQSQQGAAAGTFTTLLGVQTLRQGNSFTFSTPLPAMPRELSLGKLTDEQKTQLRTYIKHDASALAFTATDTYFAGKQLYRAAQLLQLAEQLGMAPEATAIKSALKSELVQWFDPNTGNQRHDKFFYYDTTLKGIVGEKPSFGSEDFNDHHFHYGYFLHAAAILGSYDPVFAADYEPRVTMVARDIANTRRDDPYLPYMRSFDHYAGHSWASGFAPFGAGNNQESSSEAASAWAGVYAWAQVANDPQLKQTAEALYARETASALAYYVNPDLSRPELAGYNHTIISLLWGGKADYATFFDAAPESKLAIQLLPMHPASAYLGADKTRVSTNIAQVVRETGQAPSKFKDYIIMYKALADPKTALTEAAALGDADIDGANSRSYLFAWLYAHQ